ncbi:hypothetical protein NDU88_000420 [Pleurodeles waltl]|uniref:Uncharacterized protein n=1 Tax=Pleurodeles waltl TaxID=8319 RepID=A0AAV7P3Q1_PLEWA|nr:hypothetical protein NDU88_000420 [Pleurodeles waltl]
MIPGPREIGRFLVGIMGVQLDITPALMILGVINQPEDNEGLKREEELSIMAMSVARLGITSQWPSLDPHHIYSMES